MAKTKKKRKILFHTTYNKKSFLAPNSLTSMAAIHTKIKPCGEAQIRISDCNGTIKLWNNMNDRLQVEEMLIKICNIQQVLNEFREEVKSRLN